MKNLLRNGAAILLWAAIMIFIVTFLVAVMVSDKMLGVASAQSGLRSAALLNAFASAASNSVWAFGLACIVDRLDRRSGQK